MSRYILRRTSQDRCAPYAARVMPSLKGAAQRDALLAAGLAAGAVAQLAAGSNSDDVLAYLWVASTTLPLAFRSRAPVACGLGIQLAFALGTPFFGGMELLAQGISAFLVATYVAALGAPTWKTSAASGVASCALLTVQGALDSRFEAAGAIVANCIYVAMSWAVASAVRVHVERSARSQAVAEVALRDADENARQAVLEERARLARELHDVLGHSVSVIVLRARGGVHEHRVDPQRGLDALRDIERLGTRAMADVRVLLELDEGGEDRGFRPEAAGEPIEDHRPRAPLPGTADILALVERTRTTGLHVTLHEHGERRRLSDSRELAAYRVAQEGLTNVLRHSRSTSASVVLAWGHDELTVEVVDEGPGRPATPGGRGLIGMRERVALAGGALTAGPRADGGFCVRARIPYGS